MSVNLLIETAPLGITKHMTAGSDPQPAESSTAPKMPSVSSIRHIPHILDHNYGQPPPMTPPDSNSPGPEDGDTGNEDDEDDGVTRCICNFDHDDGYMICCDKCSVWQHIECMGISSDAVPENYLCDQCQPRTLDRERARAIQERKKEEQSDDDDDDDDSEDERDTPTYTAVSNTPTRITLTAKVSQKRKRGPNKIKVKDQNVIHVESTDKEKKPKRRRRQKQKLPAGFVPVDEDTSEAWDSTCNSYDNNYEELKENIYGMELEQLALNSIQENGCLPAVANDEQLCKVVEVQRCRKGIVATEDMEKNKFIIQCKGKLMLLSKFEAENPFFKRCSPYVFYYSELDHLQLCVDARTHGNDARFARRSCSPNSEVKHFLFNGRMCLGIFSSCPLPKGSEITIPFEFQFEEYHSYLDCACRQETCAIMKYNLKLQNQNNDGHVPHKRFKLHDEDSNSGSHQKMSPLRVSLSNSHGLQGDSDSDLENNPEKRAKKSREERKLEAYLKQIEKMEKKEKRKQQTQKDHKHEQISPVSQEAPFNKLSSKNIKVMKRTLNKRRTGTPGFKRKRARLSSCSSEPLSPDDHSSTASTPTTPKVTSASSPPDVQEPCSVTPSTSPSRSFRFPKDSKQYVEEEVKETPCRNSVPALKTEPVDHSEPSAPCSPTTPQDDSDSKPVLCTANSTTDQEQLPDTSDVVTEAGNDAVCTSTTDSGQLNKDLSKSLSECLVEMNASAGSGRNTPSPCPSTAGSPTSAESVASGYSGSATERTSPGPAPGSPVATIKFGQRVSRTSPLYGSLKKRWLFQYLCGQNLVNERPPNGIRISVGNSMPRPVNGKTIPPSLRRNGLPKIIDPLPLKKRHLRKFQNMTSKSEFTFKETVQSLAREPLREEPLIVSSPVPLEQQVQIVLADSVNNLQPHKQEPITNNEQLVPNEEAGLKKDISAVPDSVESPYMTSLVSSQGTVVSIAATTAGILPRRPSDPRLVNSSPVSSSTNSAVSPGGGFPVVTSAVSPGASSVSGQPVLQFSQNSDSSGTPGKKKVSLLEYRNRSRNRLSVDLPRPPPPPPPSNAPATAPCVTPSSAFSSSVIRSSLSSSLPNLSAPSTTSSLLHRSVSSSGEMNGPHLEPVSPDLEDKSGVFHQSSKRPSSTYGRGGYSSRLESKGVIYGDGDSRLKREIQKKHEQLTRKEEGKVKLEKTLTSLISEELQKDAKSRSTAMLGQSPSSTSTESSNPSAELTGDAMDIEDDDSNCNSSIYVTTPSIPPSTHPHSTLAHSTQLPHRSSLLSQFQQPSANYRIGHSHHPPVYISQQAASQLPSPSQPPTRLPSNSPQYLVTSPSGSAHVRFQSSYQAPPSQAASFFHH